MHIGSWESGCRNLDLEVAWEVTTAVSGPGYVIDSAVSDKLSPLSGPQFK